MIRESVDETDAHTEAESLGVDLAGTKADFAVMEEEYFSGWNPTAET